MVRFITNNRIVTTIVIIHQGKAELSVPMSPEYIGVLPDAVPGVCVPETHGDTLYIKLLL